MSHVSPAESQSLDGTSTSERDPALAHLEWSRLMEAVALRCRGETARRWPLVMASTREQCAQLLSETAELMAFLASGERAPLDDLRDVETTLAHLERDGVAEPRALLDVLVSLRSARALRGFLGAHRTRAAALARAASLDPSLDRLEAELEDALEPDGTLSDRASSELRALRRETTHLRERITSRLSELIDQLGSLLSDRYFTLREGRYVLPVRSDAHERVTGIVHGTSQSGASIFVEPRAIVAQGNRLKVAEAELEREQWRILGLLADRIREQLPSLRAACDTLTRFDQRNACARFGHEQRGVVPELASAPICELLSLRHPLLALAGNEVVPNDVSLRAGQGLIISGPNAGGKTVLLKAVGLAALMVRHGLPVLCDEGSRIGFFDRVLSDLGDAQSTASNLSTFSAHVRRLSEILRTAGTGSLVLLDEVATGTDPQEGAALACALVDALCGKGPSLIATTHYEPLKAHALHAPHLRTASVGFDVERFEPSFRLLMDVPGASSALSIALRFGIPESVIDAARALLPAQVRDFERLSSELARQVAALAERNRDIEAEHKALARLRSEEESRLSDIKRRGSEHVAHEAAALLEQVKGARAELDRVRTALRAERATREQVAQAAKQVDAIAARVAVDGDLAQATSAPTPEQNQLGIDPASLVQGAGVHVPRLRADAVVLEAPVKGRTRIAVGPLKLWVDVADLRALKPATDGDHAEHKRDKAKLTPRASLRRSDNTLDVRGMRVDDALSLIESFVDRMYAADETVAYVVHGHGTGTLRDAIRKHLREHVALAQSVQAAVREDGGDALTVVRLT